MEISQKRMKKKVAFSASKKIALSFCLTILVGSILLSLPIANKAPVQPYINNLFVATSCVCVTGLTPFTIVDQYNVFGQIVMALLIQIGGLGFLTFLYLFLYTARKHITLNTKLVLSEALNQENFKILPRLLKMIFFYTFSFEALGGIVLSFFFVPKYGIIKGIYFGFWHAISSFCNAGFDIIGPNSLINYATNPYINIVVPLLIICGGIGFIVVLDIYDKYKVMKKKKTKFNLKCFLHTLSLHSKIVLIMTGILLLSGTIIFFIAEFNNPHTLGKHSFVNQVAISFFQSTTTRTAGFATVSMYDLNRITKIVMCALMFIGGSPASTAGGIKTTTFALVILMLRSVFRGTEETTLFIRRIRKRILLKAFSIFAIALLFCLIAAMILVVTEPKVDTLNLIFEVFSAFGTVGLSANVTPALSVIGKIVDIILMYGGRIGPITLLIIFTRKAQSTANKVIQYPDEDVIVG